MRWVTFHSCHLHTAHDAFSDPSSTHLIPPPLPTPPIPLEQHGVQAQALLCRSSASTSAPAIPSALLCLKPETAKHLFLCASWPFTAGLLGRSASASNSSVKSFGFLFRCLCLSFTVRSWSSSSFFLSLFFLPHHCHPCSSPLLPCHFLLTNFTAAVFPSTCPVHIFIERSVADSSIHTSAHFLIIVTASFLIFYLHLSPLLLSSRCLFAWVSLDNI